jgi:hypothetical protein
MCKILKSVNFLDILNLQEKYGGGFRISECLMQIMFLIESKVSDDGV